MFKKKSLKFSYEKVSRDLRHAEAFKARETSRFKRLSFVRRINDSSFLEKSMETPKGDKFKVPETQVIKPETQVIKPETEKSSRLEMLFKWKREKEVKKQMEKLSIKKPFYAGGNKNMIESKTSQIFKSSFTAPMSSSFNSSKFAKSKLVTPCTTVQPSRIQNSKQETPSTKIQSSKFPNSKKTLGAPISTYQLSKNVNVKGIPNSTTQTSKVPYSKQTALPKCVTNLSRSNSTAVLPRKFPASAVDKTSTSAKTTVSLTRSNSTAAVSKKFPVPSSKTDKAVSSKASIQKTHVIKKTSNLPICGNSLKSKDVSKPLKAGTGLPRFTPNATSKGITAQSKMPVSSISKNFGSNPKLNQKEVSVRKGYCFRTAVVNANYQKADILLKTPMQGTPKKLPEKISKTMQEKPSTKKNCQQIMDNTSDVIFNADISMIKPARTSFAPANFTFQAPDSLNNFIFDEEYDVYQDLEEVKMKFMSRTSTPNKSSKESLGSSNPIADVEKASDLSNSNDLRISELMTPKSFVVETEDREVHKLVNKQTCNGVVCDIITNTEIKNANLDINQQICVKETDIDVKQEVSENFASVLPEKIEFKADKTINHQISPEITSDISKDLSHEAGKKLTSVSPVKIVVTTENIETDVKNVHSKIQKHLFGKKQLFGDSDIIENPAINTVEITCNEKHLNQSVINAHNDQNDEAHEKLASVVVAADNTETVVKNTDSDGQKCLFVKKQSFDDSIEIENPKVNTIEINCKEKQSAKNGTPKKTAEDFEFLEEDDSLLDSIDLNKMSMVIRSDEDTDEDDVPSPQIPKCADRKSNGAIPKRISMLKKLSILNSIAETNECVSIDPAESSEFQVTNITPRRSKRLSKLVSVDTSSFSPMKNFSDSPSMTPRRSLRLMKIPNACDNYPVSPFQEKNRNSRRCSVRLIDLNTPEKAACEKLLGENFENLDPNKFLIDFESPTMPALPSRKISLLYSPERRKSTRKSIKGDLISFSPF